MLGELKLGIRSALIATVVAVTACVFAGSAQAITAVQTQFDNTSPITINDDADATPYPSTIDVSNALTSGYTVQVTLHNFSHTYFRDTQLLLEAPDGTFTALLRQDDTEGAASNIELAFSNTGSPLPGGVDLPSGTYAPFESPFAVGGAFDSPATSTSGGNPSFPLYGDSLSRVAHGNPNGTWKLFARDVVSGDEGEIAGGWSLALE